MITELGMNYTTTIRKLSGKTKLSPADLGLESEPGALIRLGTKLTIPDKYTRAAAAIDSGLRQTIARYSVGLPSGRFVPATAMPIVDARIQWATKAMADVQRELLDQYDNWTAELRAEYHTMGADLYTKLSEPGDRLDFIAAFVEAIPIPTMNQIARSYQITVTRSFLVSPQVAASLYLANSPGSPGLAAIAEQQQKSPDTMAIELQSALRTAMIGLVLEKLSGALESIETDGKIKPRITAQIRTARTDLIAINPAIDPVFNSMAIALGALDSDRDIFRYSDTIRAILAVATGTAIADSLPYKNLSYLGIEPAKAGDRSYQIIAGVK